MSFDFPALNVTFQVLAQDEIFSKSLFNMAAVSARSALTISFMYIKERSGPSYDPCGTPALISNMLDLMPSTTTHCFLLVK